MLQKQDLDAIRGVIREEVQGEALRDVIREEIGSAFEQVILPRFDDIDKEISGIKNEISGINNEIFGVKSEICGMKDEISGIKGEVSGIKADILEIKSTMVTKDYLEDRLADFKSTLKATGGQALRQIKLMAAELHRNGGLSAEQVVQITTA